MSPGGFQQSYAHHNIFLASGIKSLTQNIDFRAAPLRIRQPNIINRTPMDEVDVTLPQENPSRASCSAAKPFKRLVAFAAHLGPVERVAIATSTKAHPFASPKGRAPRRAKVFVAGVRPKASVSAPYRPDRSLLFALRGKIPCSSVSTDHSPPRLPNSIGSDKIMTEFMRLEETYSLAVCVARYDFTQYLGFSTTVFGQE